MTNDSILAKTSAGQDEIATRARKLSPKMRALLILVDGRRSVQDLMDTTAGFGEVQEVLQGLKELGLVESTGRRAHSAETTNRASAPLATKSVSTVAPRQVEAQVPQVRVRRRSLALARLFLLNAMEQSLRQHDGPVREHLRTATSRAELLRAFELCREIAAEVGVRHIDTIEAQFLEMLPEEHESEGAEQVPHAA
jgi:hypothetical protein